MENPALDIIPVIHTLTQAIPSKQQQAVLQYFTPNAAFTHPFCKTGSWQANFFGYEFTSRWATHLIYQWYKILSPRIDLEVLNVTFNEEKLIMYVDMHQHFRLWLVPFYDASVKLTSCLHLAEGDETGPMSAQTKQFENRYSSPSQKPYSYAAVAASEDKHEGGPKKLYYITSQEDLYQTSEWIKFLLPWNIGVTLVVVWQLYATLLCMIGALILYPVILWKEKTKDEVPKQTLPPRRFKND